MNQLGNETGLRTDSLIVGEAESFIFDDQARTATYEDSARLQGPQSDLAADRIMLFLLEDSRTLERIEAKGSIELVMPGQTVTGDSLVYHDTTGRYVMTGSPVHMTENQAGICRETMGRTLTFFLTEDAVSVDGQSQVRTETLRSDCPDQTP